MKKLYKFNWNCGRSGKVEGVFIAEEDAVTELIGQEIYFGEILGKHSEVYGEIEEGEVVEKSDDQDLIEKLEGIFGKTVSGYNPFSYIEE